MPCILVTNTQQDDVKKRKASKDRIAQRWELGALELLNVHDFEGVGDAALQCKLRQPSILSFQGCHFT